MVTNTLVTGASGFIGRRIATSLAHSQSTGLVMAGRDLDRLPPARGARRVAVQSFDGSTDWSYALQDVQVVVHAAARAHVLHDRTADPLAEFRRINTDETANLARQAAATGVRRFVFLSSLGVLGSVQTAAAFDEDAVPAPQTPYAQSKLEAEIALQQIGEATGMDIVIIRPPLVYGPSAPGNFARLAYLLRHRVPLPLGCVRNLRSLIGLDNLVDFIRVCMCHPAAANQTFLVSDGEDMSTPTLVRHMAQAMGTSATLLAIPLPVLNAIASLAGQRHVLQQLTRDLQIDCSKAHTVLNWHAPLSVKKGLARAFLVGPSRNKP